MDSFIVSARKYRPSTFNSVVGQSSITATLKNAIRTNQLAQAFLFTGPRGVGKTTCARILAKTINCTNLTSDFECCNTCESCVAFNNGQSLNIFELDAASNSTVDDMRALVEQVRYHPQGGKYRTYIIDEVHMLSPSAFNAFLKTLEEPPAYAKFILATTEKHKIIPTILSRCQIFDFNRITVTDIAHHLQYVAKSENVTAEEEALHLIAQKADGALRDALSIFDQIVSFAGTHITYKHVSENLNVLDHEYYFSFTDHVLKGELSACMLLLDEVLKDGFNLQHFVGGFSSHIRDLMVSKDPQTTMLLETTPAIREKYSNQSARISPAMLFGFLDVLTRCDNQFQSAHNQRLLVEVTLMKLCSMAGTPDLAPIAKKDPAAPSPSVTMAPAAAPTVQNPGTIPIQPIPSPPLQNIVSPISKTQEAPVSKPAPPPAATKAIRPSTISIAQTLAAKASADQDAEKEKDPAMAFVGVRLEVDQVSTVFKKISADYNEVGRKQIAHSLLAYPIKIVDDNVIEISVENTIQQDEIKSCRTELLTRLRDKEGLKCGDIRCITIPVESMRKAAFTPAEKYERMKEVNPLIAELKQRLDLNVDF